MYLSSNREHMAVAKMSLVSSMDKLILYLLVSKQPVCRAAVSDLLIFNYAGVSAGESTGATMSDDDEDYDSDYGAYDSSMDPQDSGGFGPLVPTESERTLMERVRQELKYELKQANPLIPI